MSKEYVSSSCKIANLSLPVASAICPASFIFSAVSSSTSRTMGTVHASPSVSLPVFTMLWKSRSPTNPSSGLKTPSAMFSMSFRRSLLTEMVNIPSVFLSEVTNLFMSLPPWGSGIEPTNRHHFYFFFVGSKWRPHSLAAASSHHHLPALGSSPGCTALVHGSQPMLGKPLSCSALYGMLFLWM